MPASLQAARLVRTPISVRRGADQVSAQAQRFDAALSSRIGALAAADRNFEDLMWAFPGLLHVLACAERDGPSAAGKDLGRLLCAGAPLRVIAKAAGLPMWTRRLAPEAFRGGIAANLPDGDAFARGISNHLPADPHHQRGWLAWIAAADAACDASFALWAARHFTPDRADMTDAVKRLGVFAWLCGPRDAANAGLVPPVVWQPSLGLTGAVEAALVWITHLEFAVHAAPFYFTDGPQGPVDGIDFVRLETAEAYLAEAKALRNCVDSYAESVADGSVEIWSLRRDGERVALLEIQWPEVCRGIPRLQQLRGPGNAEVGDDVAAAAYRWLLTWPRDAVDPSAQRRRQALDAVAYRRIFKPYWLAKGLVDWCGFQNGDYILGSTPWLLRCLNDPGLASSRRGRPRRRRGRRRPRPVAAQ